MQMWGSISHFEVLSSKWQVHSCKGREVEREVAMMRRAVAAVLLLCFVTMSFFSCSGDAVTSLDGKKAPGNDREVAAVRIDDPGAFHNEILSKINEKHSLVLGEKLSRMEFSEIFTHAANEALADRGETARVHDNDVAFVISRFDRLREDGIFDFFAHPGERGANEIHTLLNYLQSTETIDPVVIERFRDMVEELERVGFSISNRERVYRIAEVSKWNAGSSCQALHAALDVAAHSYDFWTRLEQNTVKRARISDSNAVPFVTIDWFTINTLLWDAVAILLFWNTGPFAVIAGVIASCIYVIMET